jgi:hypothetical protein
VVQNPYLFVFVNAILLLKPWGLSEPQVGDHLDNHEQPLNRTESTVLQDKPLNHEYHECHIGLFIIIIRNH